MGRERNWVGAGGLVKLSQEEQKGPGKARVQAAALGSQLWAKAVACL